MTHPIFNRSLLKTHRDNAARNIKDHDFLLQLSSNQLFDHINALRTSYDRIIELGARDGILTKKLMNQYQNSYILSADISASMLKNNPAKHKIILDEENIAPNLKDFDLVTSVLNAHWINDLPTFFKNIKKILKPGGIVVLSLFGGSSLKNLRTILLESEIATKSSNSPHISPFVLASDLYKILQYAGFSFIVVEDDNIEVEYDNPIALMRELKNMAESNKLFASNKILPKKVINQLKKSQGPFADSFEIITLVAS